MSKLGDALRGLDARATKGPWRIAEPSEYPWILGGEYRGEETLTILGGGSDRGYGVLSVPLSVTDHHGSNWQTVVALRNALPELAALADAAEALRVLDTSPLYGAHAAWAKDGNSKAARLLEERDERIHVAVTGYDAALAAVLAKLNPATAPEKGDGK